ncbi:molybdopterin-guanine dinucleotide biosynthesis protein MobB [Pedobacter sp. PACM 27299]|uniref:DUF5712 family protein n=1 Tax=Pedobacter sp. PACM 27299 TaxID=1727164 RepID=UPI000705CDD1|nr:DUF5712 family protein [Pedobacter sp. PACM 27299]ALL05592.1 molybdopterin-guanine dinucleotide biosynthesis protein MobB [Pedobacter sp. PACM 27299]
MHINITDSEKGNNKGSSAQLVHYLDKENRVNEDAKLEFWFNGSRADVPSYEVKMNLDGNIAKLCRDDAKFFLINISPSQKEIAHLKTLYSEQQLERKLKAYAIKVMDEYARNFKRPGIESHRDLLWYGKLEHYRYYGFNDPEVIQGLKELGKVKPGDQLHLQIIVSRKNISNKIKLSPMNKSRGRNLEHSKKVGEFDRSAFKNSGERVFDQAFDFKRGLAETFEYVNAQKNGSLEIRLAMEGKLRAVDQQKEYGRDMIQPIKSFLPAPKQHSFLDMLLAKSEYDPISMKPGKKKRKLRKGQQPEHGQGL